ncbi:MAG TPA: prenyltransferase/squalene oxidase repeat-containing protein, partial [Candidatus Paceibacterota bacterium]|nr:prenyltransferase/squalene oxidase repeat-containing protein [Candidatus Paceibacterota bacterium]
MNTHTAREKALSYVLRVQEKDGGWKSATAADTAGMLQPAVHTTTFAATLILNAIAALPDSLLKQSIVRRGVAYLRTEASTAWTYNYWKRGSSDAKTTVYPDDTDDTFCALAALSQLAPTVVDGTVLAKSVALLTAQEAAVGGPYRTWIIDPKQKRWHNIDIGVNSNIAYFLSLHGIELPRLTAYVEHEIEREVYASEFYHNPYLVIYFISRFYTGKNKETLISFLLKKRTKGGTWGTVLDTALALTTLIRLGYTGSVI